MRVKENWWKDFFNDIYLITDARSVCNSALTCKEVRLLEKFLNLDKNDRILDFCGGQGRHSLELARCGYRDLTVLDSSDYLIKLGRKTAKDAGWDIRFICADGRFSKLKRNDYSVIFLMANSFGYFLDEKENIRILKEIYRLLKNKGRLLLDLTDFDYIKNNLKPLSWHEANKDVVVCRQRQLRGNIIKAREVVISKKRGLLRDRHYCERLYSQNKINRFLQDVGFKNVTAKKALSLQNNKQDYGFLTSRVIVTAAK